jgi:hypothetical protein
MRDVLHWLHVADLHALHRAGAGARDGRSDMETAEYTVPMTEGEGSMDILVMLEENPEHSAVLAHVNSVPSPLDVERPSRDIVTIYGEPSAESLALALAAAVEIHRDSRGGASGQLGATTSAIRHLGVWPERGALGDAAWRDVVTGQLVTRDLEIPLEILHATASQLLTECGQLIRRLVAGLSMPDWPEGARRAINVTLGPIVGLTAPMFRPLESALEAWREADGLAFDSEGD